MSIERHVFCLSIDILILHLHAVYYIHAHVHTKYMAGEAGCGPDDRQ
jgi:hypothetical protein